MDVEERLHARDEEDNITRSLRSPDEAGIEKGFLLCRRTGRTQIVRTEDVFNFVTPDPDFKGKVKSVNKLTSLLAEKLRNRGVL